MNPRNYLRCNFLKLAGCIITIVVVASTVGFAQDPANKTNGRTDITLRIPGVVKPFTFAHVSDLHICYADSRNSELLDFVSRRENVFSRHGFGSTYQTTPKLFKRTNETNPDLVIITGDYIDIPTEASLEVGAKLLDSLDAGIIFAIGNHEWIGNMLKVYADRDYWNRRYEKLVGHPIEFYVRPMQGVNLVCVNHSAVTNRITEQQLQQTKNILEKGRPCIFFMHVPIPLELRPGREITETTAEFYELLKTNPQVKAIFAGHTHIENRVEYRSGHFQYIVQAGFKNHYNYITVLPVD